MFAMLSEMAPKADVWAIMPAMGADINPYKAIVMLSHRN
jgi:hypothetical protein